MNLHALTSINFMLNQGEAVFELLSFDKWSEQRKKNTKNGTFATAHFCV